MEVPKKRTVRDILAERKAEPPKKVPEPVKAPTTPAKPAAAKPKAPPPAKKPKDPIRHDKVTAKCGHIVEVPVFPDDKHLAMRTEKATSKKCQPCRQADHAAQEAKIAEKKAAKEAAKATQPEQPPPGPPAEKKMRPAWWRSRDRLPDGSVYHSVYHADRERWEGTLSIPLPDGTVKVFEAEKSGVMVIQRKLDDMYRDWLQQQSWKKEEPPTKENESCTPSLPAVEPTEPLTPSPT